ncbi:nidogen-like domain-containing protein [Ditylenchus destructor]|nr:nidogen-like domain-containing protein [Ditylenchus destructor]
MRNSVYIIDIFRAAVEMLRRLIIICVVLFFCYSRAEVPLEDFFVFGPQNGDDEMANDTTHSSRILLNPPFLIYNKSRDYVQVNANGSISIYAGLIIVHEHFSNRLEGNVYWRVSSSVEVLGNVSCEIGSSFPAYQGIELKWAFVATWYRQSNGPVRQLYWPNYGRPTIEAQNTFQAILATDGIHSFAIFYYNNVDYQRSRFDASTREMSVKHVNGQLHEGAGFILRQNGTHTYFFHQSMRALKRQSNVGKPGKWIFRIDLPEIYPAGSLCHKPIQPENGYCKAHDYVTDSKATCDCLFGFAPNSTTLKCIYEDGTQLWSGDMPTCTLASTTHKWLTLIFFLSIVLAAIIIYYKPRKMFDLFDKCSTYSDSALLILKRMRFFSK